MPARGRHTALLCTAVLAVCAAVAQQKQDYTNNTLGFQYGFSFKALIEFSYRKETPNPMCRFSAVAGVGSAFLSPNIHPSFHVECQLYNGGLGSMKREQYRKPSLTLDIITAFTLTAGFKNYLTASRAGLLEGRNVPLYYFADFAYPPLLNPFSYSLSAGTNLIFTTDHHKCSQRIGFINGHFDRVQVSYYNDGGKPIYDTYLGDRRDRYYTGGAVISYHGRAWTAMNLVELSYHKFTGYSKNAFEVSNKLDLAYVNYNKPEQQYYNRSMWTLNIANPEKGLGLAFKVYNKTSWDAQHLIHWGLFNAYHLVPYEENYSLGIQYYYRYLNTGLQ